MFTKTLSVLGKLFSRSIEEVRTIAFLLSIAIAHNRNIEVRMRWNIKNISEEWSKALVDRMYIGAEITLIKRTKYVNVTNRR